MFCKLSRPFLPRDETFAKIVEKLNKNGNLTPDDRFKVQNNTLPDPGKGGSKPKVYVAEKLAE